MRRPSPKLRPRPWRSRLAVVAVAGGMLSACAATPHASEGIGMARVGLSLAFADQALATGPVPPQVIVKLIPAPPQVLNAPAATLAQYAVKPAAPKPLSLNLCPKAAPGTPAPPSAPPAITAAPAEGYYTLYNSGTIKVTADGLSIQLPYPAITTMQVTGVTVKDNDTVPGVVATASPVTDFQEITTLTSTDIIKDEYQYNATEMDLVSHSEDSSGTVTADTYSPAVKIYETSGVGSSWSSVGTDLSNKRALVFKGDIKSQSVVDACGVLLDTYAVTSTSNLADLSNDQESGTTAGQSDVQYIATQVGGLFAEQQLHDTQVEEVNGASVTIETDVTSILSGHAPSPTPPSVASLYQ